ncbi:MAG: hypothetical protein ACO3HC_05865 [Flavobacteriaceae bacterium]
MNPSFGQNSDILCNQDNIVFAIPNTDEFVVINSENSYTIFPEKISYKFPENLNISDNISRYRNVITLDQSVYLIHNGGGEIVEFKNKAFKRIDNSFLHHNQYSPTPFSYNGTLYLFAGSGLFLTKNILIKYDFETREWFKVFAKGEVPPPGKNYFGIVIDDKFYAFLGDIALDQETHAPNKSVFELDLITLIWTYKGELINFDSQRYNQGEFNGKKSFIVDNKYYFLKPTELVEIDILNNTVNRYYDSEKWYSQGSNSTNFLRSDEQYLYFQRCNSMRVLDEFKVKKSEFQNSAKLTQQFYDSSSERIYRSFGVILISALLLMVVLIFLNEFSIDNKISIKVKSASFLYKLKIIKIFSDTEKHIILIMATENQISFSKIEDLCSEKNDSQDVRVKKREKIIKFLNAKLNGIFNNNEEIDFFISISNAEDKRIKCLKLNPIYFKIK